MEENSQCFGFAPPAVTVSANEGRVPATCRFQFGVVVPMPILPLVVKLPFEVVVALPPTQRLFAMERLVEEALARVDRPETASVEVAVSAPPKKEVPLVYWLPCIERSDVGEVVPMPTLPATYALPVVVAPPEIVSPPACVPSPMVEEAEGRRGTQTSGCGGRTSPSPN